MLKLTANLISTHASLILAMTSFVAISQAGTLASVPAQNQAPLIWSQISSFDTLYSNQNADPQPGQGVRNCIDMKFDNWETTKQDAAGKLDLNCQPDTLYLWLPADRVRAIEMTLGQGPWPSKVPTLFLSKSPAWTYGYGDTPVRVKLRAGVQFRESLVLDDKCSKYTKAEYENTVFYRKDGWFADWSICSPNVIHSWSYGTKAHHDEIIRDVRTARKLLMNGQDLRGNVELYSGLQGISPFNHNIDNDVTQFNWSYFVNDLLILNSSTRQGNGQIYFNPTLKNSEATPAVHFQSNEHMYFMAQ